MTTLDVVPKKKPEPSAEELAARELVRLAREQGLSLTGPDGLLKQLTKRRRAAQQLGSEEDAGVSPKRGNRAHGDGCDNLEALRTCASVSNL
jgi:hypothetical protein